MNTPFLRRLYLASPSLVVTGILMVPVLAVAIGGLLIDRRLITGAPAWLKPAKFSVSIAIYVFTLAWIFTLLPEWRKMRRVVGSLTAAVMILELVIIVTQAYRGRASHFNFSTTLDGVLFATMGTAIVVQTLSTTAVAIALWRQPFTWRPLGWALRSGMVITIVGALLGGIMSRITHEQLAGLRGGRKVSMIGAHTVGASDGGPGLPGTGWSTGHGDLRVAHFAGLHALQVLALFAVVMKRRSQLGEKTQLRAVAVAAGSYAALVGGLLAQALAGQPLLSIKGESAPWLALWAGITGTAAWLAVRRRPVAAG